MASEANRLAPLNVLNDSLPYGRFWVFTEALIDQPVRIVRPAGRSEIRFVVSRKTRRRIEHAERRIARAA